MLTRKYRISVEGKNFKIRLEKVVQQLGFYTTRFIIAENEAVACETALDLIRNELKEIVLNEPSDPPMMFIEETVELDSFGDNMVPGKGFTWFEED